jgi:hypothetical protein
VKVAVFILVFSMLCFSDSYQKCKVLQIVIQKTDTSCVCEGKRYRKAISIPVTRFKERPVVRGNTYTVRNKPYKRHTKLVFEMPIQGIVTETEIK